MPSLDEVNALKLWDYQIQHFDGSRLLVIGGNDLTYYHDVELVFTGVVHISCDTNFSHPQFSDSGSCHCVCGAYRTGIKTDEADFAIVAENREIIIGTVFHYQRKDLKPGERIAPWVDVD